MPKRGIERSPGRHAERIRHFETVKSSATRLAAAKIGREIWRKGGLGERVEAA
jgi:hypothetical protein